MRAGTGSSKRQDLVITSLILARWSRRGKPVDIFDVRRASPRGHQAIRRRAAVFVRKDDGVGEAAIGTRLGVHEERNVTESLNRAGSRVQNGSRRKQLVLG